MLGIPAPKGDTHIEKKIINMQVTHWCCRTCQKIVRQRGVVVVALSFVGVVVLLELGCVVVCAVALLLSLLLVLAGWLLPVTP